MPTLNIGDLSFECRPNLSKWRLLELASSMKGDTMAQAAGMHDFVIAVLKPAERDRFVAAMRALDDDDEGDDLIGTLNEAVGSLIEEYAAPEKGAASPRPTGRSSASASGRKPDGGTSRVDSPSPGTHRVLKLSQPRGR